MWAAAVAGALAWSGPAAAQGAGASEDPAATGTGAGAGGQQSGQSRQQGQIDDQLKESLQKLHATNQAEVQLAKAAQNQAQSSRVKEFARTMIQEHQKNDQQLQQTAQRLGVQLQGEAYQEALEEQQEKGQALQQRKGAGFDTAFMTQMVDSHKQTLDDVHDAATRAAEQGVTQLAQVLGQTEAKLHQHSAMAQQIQLSLQQQQAQSQGQSGTGAGAGAQDPAATGTTPGGQPGVTPPPPSQDPQQDQGSQQQQ